MSYKNLLIKNRAKELNQYSLPSLFVRVDFQGAINNKRLEAIKLEAQ